MENRSKKFKKRISKTAAALALCLALVAGTAGAAFADTTGSPFIDKTYTHNARFSGYVVANGVDASWWQSDASNWSSAKAVGVDYAILRVTHTSTVATTNPTLGIDSRFAGHYAKCKAAGVMVGAYVFSQARTAEEAVKEANYAVARLKALGIGPNDLDLPVYFDYEFNSRLKAKHLNMTIGTQAANAFCNVLKSNGYKTGIYASLTFINKYLNLNAIPEDVDIWCAQYNTSCGLAGRYSKWQYTSSGKVDGLLNSTGLWNGSIDCNFWYLNPGSEISPGVSVSGGGVNYPFTGAPVTPAMTVTSSGVTLRQGVDYKIGYINNIKPGTAYALIQGIGAYSGYKLVPFTIGGTQAAVEAASAIPVTKIKSLKGGKKSFTVKVKKKSKSQVTGYQVRYSRNPDMSDSVVKNISKKYNKTSKTIKTNAGKRNYYVQVRSYKKAYGVLYFSNWSTIKKVKVK